MEIVRCYQSFIERLDQAIVQQGQQVLATQAALEAAQRRVQEREIRVATIERLMQRHARQIAQAEARREQKTMDEMALRRHGPASAAMLRVA